MSRFWDRIVSSKVLWQSVTVASMIAIAVAILLWVPVNTWIGVEAGFVATLLLLALALVASIDSGQLPALLDAWFPSRRQVADESIAEFLTQAQQVRGAMVAFADAYQNPDQIVAALDELRSRDARQKRAEMESVANEVQVALERFLNSLNYAIRVSRGKESSAQAGPAAVSEAKTTSVEPPSPPSDQGSDASNLDPQVMYQARVPNPQTGQAEVVNVSGAQVREWTRSGARQNVDFFILGLASSPSANPSNYGLY